MPLIEIQGEKYDPRDKREQRPRNGIEVNLNALHTRSAIEPGGISINPYGAENQQ